MTKKSKNETFLNCSYFIPISFFFQFFCTKYLIICLNHFSIHYDSSIWYSLFIKPVSIPIVSFYSVLFCSPFVDDYFSMLTSLFHWFLTLDIHKTTNTKSSTCFTSQVISFILWYFIQYFNLWFRGYIVVHCNTYVRNCFNNIWNYFFFLIHHSYHFTVAYLLQDCTI